MTEAQGISRYLRRKRYGIIGTFLGLLGTANLMLIALYMLSIYYSASGISSIEKLMFPIFLAAALTIISAMMLACGSYQIWKARPFRGGAINLVAGTIPIPVYVYFTFFSYPSLLGWLGLLGCFLLLPGPISGIISIFLANER